MAENNPFEDSEIHEAAGIRSEPLPDRSSLDEAFDIVKVHMEGFAPFTNAQLDLCAEVIATQLPEHEREYAREIATSNGYPLWLVLLAQWRRCNEYGEVAALIPDPDWIAKAEEK